MRIVDKTKYSVKMFEHLKLEDVFRWDGRLFMKVSNYCDEGSVNAYDFDKHRLTDFSSDTEVTFVLAELILHAEGWDRETC